MHLIGVKVEENGLRQLAFINYNSPGYMDGPTAANVLSSIALSADEKFLAVGGVNPDNVKEFMATGISGVGVGGGLANAAWVKEGRLDEIEALARTYVNNVK